MGQNREFESSSFEVNDKPLKMTNSMETENVQGASAEVVIMTGVMGNVENKLTLGEETKRWMGAIKKRMDAVNNSESHKWLTHHGWKILIQNVEHDLNLKFKSIPREYR